MRKVIAMIMTLMLMAGCFPATGAIAADTQATGQGNIQNVILLISDGMSQDAMTLSRWYQGGQTLAMDEIACGLVRTYSADAAIADSAPAGTAFATGYKSHTGYVGVLPDAATMPGQAQISASEQKKPVASILEAAKMAGKSTGLVATCEIMHATPADFAAHYPDRKNYDVLSKQMVYNDVDVVLGGGYQYLQLEGRKDKQDMIKVIRDMGYDYVTTQQELNQSNATKIWGAFAATALKYEMDDTQQEEPSLAEMTTKAIDTLSMNRKGFFLMVEGSKIDWAAHANDPIGVISDVLAFDQAVKVALDYAKKDGHTAVIAVSDHCTGGMSIGDAGTTKTYDKEPLATFIAPLKQAQLTGEGIEYQLNADRSNIVEVMKKYMNIDNLSEAEITSIKNAKATEVNYAVGPIISKRAHIGWTTGGHTGGDVTLYAYAPDNSRPTGVIDNTDIAKYMAQALGLNLSETTKKLYIPARSAFENAGAAVAWDATDTQNPVVVVTKGDKVLRFPVNTDIVYINSTPMHMDSLTVYNGTQTYVSEEALNLLN